MSMLESEIWRIGIIQAPIEDVANQTFLDQAKITWIEADQSMCFLADPFGIWHEGILYVFAEHYDYRTHKGVIVVYLLDAQLEVIEHRVVLEEAWHLSYPYIIEAEGEIWMLPEGYKSGELSLYRAVDFPWSWEKVDDAHFPCTGIDASLLFADGYWWLFHTPPSPKEARTSTLMLAKARQIKGPWQSITQAPIHHDRAGARMGGTPFIQDGQVFLPTQDCSLTYGGAIRLLSISLDQLDSPVIQQCSWLHAPHTGKPYTDGFHTLSAVNGSGQRSDNTNDQFSIHPPITLIDTKREIRGSLHRIGIEVIRGLGLKNAKK